MIKENSGLDMILKRVMEALGTKQERKFIICIDGILRLKRSVNVQDYGELKGMTLKEGHKSCL